MEAKIPYILGKGSFTSALKKVLLTLVFEVAKIKMQIKVMGAAVAQEIEWVVKYSVTGLILQFPPLHVVARCQTPNCS